MFAILDKNLQHTCYFTVKITTCNIKYIKRELEAHQSQVLKRIFVCVLEMKIYCWFKKHQNFKDMFFSGFVLLGKAYMLPSAVMEWFLYIWPLKWISTNKTENLDFQNGVKIFIELHNSL